MLEYVFEIERNMITFAGWVEITEKIMITGFC
jgi:hypothetical protein